MLVNKYAHHLPLYRLSQIFDRGGADLVRSSLAVWVGNSADLLEPLADAIGRLVLSAEVIFSDDTPVSMHARSQDHQSRRTDAMALERLAVTPDACAFTTLDSTDESFTELVQHSPPHQRQSP